jgi:putative NIF3 family GTP cyclohydrolase 1 type 2
VTGEPAERSMARAREAEVHFLAAGHYATETFGVRALVRAAGRALRHPPRLRRRANPI